ncbi:MAG: lipid IV(A) 3-deoxy-D-manno-octulosonic acid transferase [Pseudomonadota bacterium]|nr:lipid IV(A) 3-deoxy-D-manno-octulosonic acid transferase [Pseudomonadota bacterium]
MRDFYTIVIYFLIPFILLRLLLVSFKYPSYRKKWYERFGFINWKESSKPIIWIHAVSIGEVNATRPIVNLLLKKYPHYQIIITTVTPTGAKTVVQQYKSNVFHFYLPYDIPYCVKKFIRTINPCILITMETEIWPNLYQICHQSEIPILIVNARLSQKSMSGYQLFSGLIVNTLKLVDKVAAQTQADADRFITLGVSNKDISVVGNLKFDIDIPQSIKEEAEPLRHDFSVSRPIWMAASTHDGEEEIILNAHKSILSTHPDAILILAPRHPDRADKIFTICKKMGLHTIRRTEQESFSDQHNVFLLDTLGELQLYYAASEIAFVGGSLVNTGGQNMLEPAALNLPLITGPYTYNFLEVRNLLLESEALIVVSNSLGLSEKVIELIGDANLRHSMGERARAVVLANRGSSERVITMIKPYLLLE